MSMIEPAINEVKKKVDSRYTLVVLAAKRGRDIVENKPLLLDVDESEREKPISVAAREIDEELITYSRK